MNPYKENEIEEIENSEKSEEIFKNIKEINISDKWIYEKATKTFVSYIRFYSEHDLKYIFDVKTLDLGNLANSLCLLRMPRIKEILGKKVENFIQDESINPKELVYQNSNTAKQMEQKEEKIKKLQEERKIKKEEFQAALESKKNEKRNRTRKEKKEAKVRSSVKEWDDFADDDRIYKKFKKGKISKEQYEKLLLQMK